MTITEQFDAAKPTGERMANYGHPADDFERAHAIKEAVRDCEDVLLRHALELIGVKMARLVHNPYHVDGWIDIAGYARTACMIMDRQLQDTENAKQNKKDVTYYEVMGKEPV